MECVICKKGRTSPGKTTVTLEKDGTTLVVKSVPARICENCGERYLDEEISKELLEQAEQASKAGIQVEVREYVAA